MGIRVTAKHADKHQHSTVQAKHVLMSLVLTIGICSAFSALLFYIKFNPLLLDDAAGHMLCYEQPTQINEEKEDQQTDAPQTEYIKKNIQPHQTLPIINTDIPQNLALPYIDGIYENEMTLMEGMYPNEEEITETISTNEEEDLIAFFNLCNEEWPEEEPPVTERKHVAASKKDVSQASDYRPPQYLATPKPEYPALLKRKRIQGSVRVRIHVDEQGMVSKVEILQSTHDDFAASARSRILADWRFTPAQRNGKAVADVVVTSVIFE